MRLRSGMIAPRNYKRLAGSSDEEEEEYSDHSTIEMPRAYKSSSIEEVMVYMIWSSTEMNQRLEAHEQLIQE